jgi:hypothetical protein
MMALGLCAVNSPLPHEVFIERADLAVNKDYSASISPVLILSPYPKQRTYASCLVMLGAPSAAAVLQSRSLRR